MPPDHNLHGVPGTAASVGPSTLRGSYDDRVAQPFPFDRHPPSHQRRNPPRPYADRDRAEPRANETTTVGPNLRTVLVTGDVVAAAAGWLTAAGVVGDALPVAWLAVLPLAVAAVLLSMAAQDLYRTRTCATVALETLGATRAIGCLTVPAALWASSLPGSAALVGAATTAGLVWISVLTERTVFRTWIRARRRAGVNTRTLLLVGGDHRTQALADPIEGRPELGFRVIGVVGPPGHWNGSSPPRLGGLDDLERVVEATDVSGALIDAGTLGPAELNGAVRTLNRLGVHVHLSSGLRGVAAHRLRPHALAHEGLLYVEPVRMSRPAQAAKRAFDLVAGTILLFLAAPILALAAVAIRLDDGGPTVFRQVRVGLGGRTFTLYKLRTMSADAEDRKGELQDRNQRDGPLFKVAGDPRVTRVGRFLRASSIDELPQLVNVLSGQMSLVGPRPALPSEVAEFDEELLARADVKPGLSGLWQVEGRDDTSFEVYRRLDLFYVENWSLGLDATIVLLTIPVVLGRLTRAVRRRVGPDVAGDAVLD